MHILQDELVSGMAISGRHSRVITPLCNEDGPFQTGLLSELGGPVTNLLQLMLFGVIVVRGSA